MREKISAFCTTQEKWHRIFSKLGDNFDQLFEDQNLLNDICDDLTAKICYSGLNLKQVDRVVGTSKELVSILSQKLQKIKGGNLTTGTINFSVREKRRSNSKPELNFENSVPGKLRDKILLVTTSTADLAKIDLMIQTLIDNYNVVTPYLICLINKNRPSHSGLKIISLVGAS